jgi:hypothetical protein
MKRETAAARSTVRRAEFQARVWVVSQDCRVWKIRWWLGITLQFSPADADTGGPPPARVILSFFPPGATAAVSRDEIPITASHRIDDLCLCCPPELIHSHRRTNNPQQPAIPPTPHTPSKLFALLSDSILRRSSSVRFFQSHWISFLACTGDSLNGARSPLDDVERELPSSNVRVIVRRKVSGIQDGGNSGGSGGDVGVWVMVFVFVLRCRVGEDWGVDGRRGPKNPFRLPRNHPVERDPLFQSRTGNFGRRAAFEGDRNSGGSRNNSPFPFLFLLYRRLLDRSGGMSLRLVPAVTRIRKKWKTSSSPPSPALTSMSTPLSTFPAPAPSVSPPS